MKSIARLEDRWNKPKQECKIYTTQVPTEEGAYALLLIERFGTIEGRGDGEDSAGRHKGRLATPAEVIERAFTLAERAFAELHSRGWVLDLPVPLAEVREKDVEAAG